MKKSLKEIAIHGCAYVFIGAAVMAGMRAVEWLIPGPGTRVFVCMYDDRDKLECKPAAVLLKKQ